MKRFFILIFAAHLFSTVGLGQDQTLLLEREAWHTRAETLTSNLLKDAAKRDDLDRALLLAQLSELWWESDRGQSNTWIEKSVDLISFYPSSEAKAQSEKFFSVSRQVLALISTRNRKQADRLLEILSKTGDIPGKEKESNADTLIEFALQIVKDNPNKAAELGVRAFGLGHPKRFYELSWALRRYSPALADKFFRTAFSFVTASPDDEKLSGMQLAALPESAFPDFPLNLKPPVELKLLFLNFLADYLVQQQIRFASKLIPSCSTEAVLVSRLKNYFTELLPQKSALMQQMIDICLAPLSRETKQLIDETGRPRASDVEELLSRADENQNSPLLNANYLFRAALAASQQKNYEKAIQILEAIDADERKIAGDLWEELRSDSGALLAASQFKNGNVAMASKTLQDVPVALRPLAQIAFVLQFSPKDVSSYEFCVGLLNDARRGMVKSELPFTRKTSYWLSLVKLYSNYNLPTQAPEVFREIAVAFNNSLSNDTPEGNDAASDQLISDSQRIIPTLSPALLEMQEEAIFESVNLLKEERPRLQINLALLKLALKRYQSFNSAAGEKPEAKQHP